MGIAVPIDFNVGAGGLHFAGHHATGASNHDLIRLYRFYEDGDVVTKLHSSRFTLLKLVMQINYAVSGRDLIKAETAIRIRAGSIINIQCRLRAAIRSLHLIIGVQSNVLIWLDFVADAEHSTNVAPRLQGDLARL